MDDMIKRKVMCGFSSVVENFSSAAFRGRPLKVCQLVPEFIELCIAREFSKLSVLASSILVLLVLLCGHQFSKLLVFTSILSLLVLL